MTKEGATKLIMTMVAAYPNFHPADMTSTIKIWHAQLDAYRDDEVAAALKAFILSDASGFAPTIGQVVALIPRNQGDGMSELEAWGLVAKAIRNGNYGAEEEFAKLPDNIRAAVGSAGQIRQWASIDMNDLETVAQSNFLRSYRAVVKREEMAWKLPDKLRAIYHKDPPKAELPEKPAVALLEMDGIPMPMEYRKKLGLPE